MSVAREHELSLSGRRAWPILAGLASLLLISFLTTSTYAQLMTWRPPERLTNDAATSSAPAIAADVSGFWACVVWEDSRSGHWEIFHKVWDGSTQTWGPEQQLSEVDGFDSRNPFIASEMSGQLHVVWEDMRVGHWEVFYKTSSYPPFDTWSADQQLTEVDLYDSRAPIVVVAGMALATAHVFWEDNRSGHWEVFWKMGVGGGFPATDEQVSQLDDYDSRNPAAAGDPNNMGSPGMPAVAVAWEDGRDGSWEIYGRQCDLFGAWSALENPLTSWDSGPSRSPSVSGPDFSGLAQLVWQNEGDGDLEIYHTTWSQDGAYGYTQLTHDDSPSQNPWIAWDPSQLWTLLLWEDYRHGQAEIYAMRRDTYGGWNPEERLTDEASPSLYPRALLYSNVARMVWHDERDGNPEVYYAFGRPNYSPSCNAGGPYAAESGEELHFNGWAYDPDGSIVSYVWDFGDGGTATGPTPTHAYAAAGTFTVTLCVTDDFPVQSCCQTTAEITMSDANTVTPGPVASCVSVAQPCVTVPVRIARTAATPLRGFSVRVTLSPELAVCGTGITQGGYLSAVGATAFQVTGTNPYTVDCAILGLPCGATAPAGTLFNVAVTGVVPEATGAITVNAVTLRDCGNADVPAATGPAAPIAIDAVAPAAVANLVVTQVKTGNDTDGTTLVALDFTPPTDADSVLVWRKGYGCYPEYDDGGGSVPAVPVDYPPADWERIYGGPAYGGVDTPATRDFWYYLVYTRDECGNVSAVSNLGGGCLNYHLGDVSDGLVESTGDNDVEIADISLLGDHYREQPFPGAYNYLDVGPTTNHTVDGRPTTDNRIDFEDLMMFAINYGQVGLVGDAPEVADGAGTAPELMLETEATAEGLVARLVLMGNGEVVKGVSARLDVGGTLEVTAVEQGALLGAQAAPVFFERVDAGIDCAVLGAGEVLRGSGEVAVVWLRGRGAVTLAAADLRDARNRAVGAAAGVAPEAAPMPAELALLAARPNPFNPSTTLTFRLPEVGRVTLAIYDVTGVLVRRLVEGDLAAGEHAAFWDGRSDRGQAVGSGVYVARLATGGYELTQKLHLLK